MAGPRGEPHLLRICLDLNVWVAGFLSTIRGRRGGSSPWLVDTMRSGVSQAGPVQLVISFSMLDRLSLVLIRSFGVTVPVADALVRAIGNIAEFGPAGDFPHIVLGGSVYPIRDEEDRTVLDVAVSGQADLLVTANLRDFAMAGITDAGAGTMIYCPVGRAPLIIAHPDRACGWLRDGIVPGDTLLKPPPRLER